MEKSEYFHQKNHFVPQSYLKQWGNENNQVLTYRLLVPNINYPIWKEYSTRAICYHNYLYTKNISGKEVDDFERWFDREFETPAQSSIQKVTQEEQLHPKDYKNLIRFFAAQDVRTPLRLEQHIKDFKKMFNESVESVNEKIKHIDYSGSVHIGDDYKNGLQLPLKISRDNIDGETSARLKIESFAGRASWLSSIQYVLRNTINELYKHRWTILKPYEGLLWYTSDNPTIRLNYYEEGKYDLKGGWGRNKTNLMLPLNPLHLLFTQIGDNAPKRYERLSEDQTIFIRKIIAENADRMIFSNIKDPAILKYRRRYINSEVFKQEKKQWEKWHEEQFEEEDNYIEY